MGTRHARRVPPFPRETSMSASYSEHLVAHIRSLLETPLTDAVLEKARMCLLDHLAAVMSAANGDVARIGQNSVSMFGEGNCSLLATSKTASPAGAVFYNALTATAEDLDDAHRFASGLHMSSITFPVLFALSELDKVSGETFIRAMLAGYEISSRMVRAADAGLRDRGYHSTGAAGIFGSCAAASVLLNLSDEQRVNALGIAASGGGGLFAFLKEGSSVRHAHAAWASVNGLSAAMLAASGMTGPRQALEGYGPEHRDGYLRAYAGTWDESFITNSCDRPELLNAYHKIHATCGHAAPGITALQELREQILPNLDTVTAITIKGYKASAALNNPAPRSVSEAKFSLPFITGMVLLFGRATKLEMTEANLANPDVRRIAALVRVEEDPGIAAVFPRLRACEVNVTFANGTSLSRRVDAPLGMPENPVSLHTLENKFLEAGGLSSERQTAVLRLVRDLDALPDMGLLVKMARC